MEFKPEMSVPGGVWFLKNLSSFENQWHHGDANNYAIMIDGLFLLIYLCKIRVISQFSGGDREITKL